MSENEIDESIFMEDEAWADAEVHDNEELNQLIKKEKETLNEPQKEKEILTLSDEEGLALLKIAVFGKEREAHEKLGYKIPRSKESLSKLSVEDEEKLWLIRNAMVNYAMVAAGQEKFGLDQWYLPHKEEIDINDYIIGENQF